MKLDIGCGESFDNVRYIGIDIDAELLEWAETPPHIIADARDLPLKDNVADEVLMSKLLCDMDEGREEAIREALRVLKPGGILRIIDYADEQMQSIYFRLPEEAIVESVELVLYDEIDDERIVEWRLRKP